MKAQDLITSAMKLLGVLASGETADSVELSDALTLLNAMIDGWNTERLALYTINKQTFGLTAGVQTYSLGAGQTFNVARPTKIERGVLQITNAGATNLEIGLKMFSDEEWAAIGIKALGNTYPEGFWDDGNFPYRGLNFWPVPSGPGLNVVLYLWQTLTAFPDLNSTDITFPPGYERALRFNFAAEAASLWTGAASSPDFPNIMRLAAESKSRIKMLNDDPPKLSCDPAVTASSSLPAVSRADFLGGRF